MPNGEQDIKFLTTMVKRLDGLCNLVRTGRFDASRPGLVPMAAKAKAKLERLARLVEEQGMDGSIVRRAYPALYDNGMPLEQRENLLAEAHQVVLGAYAAKRFCRNSGDAIE